MGGKDAASPRYVFTKLEVNQYYSILNRPNDVTSVLLRLEPCSSHAEFHFIKYYFS